MVRAADDLKTSFRALGGDGVEVNLTGASGHVVGLQPGQQERDAEVAR